MSDQKTKNKKDEDDPDFVYFDRAKSHNNAFYRKTEGVCTNNRMELEKIKRTSLHTDFYLFYVRDLIYNLL